MADVSLSSKDVSWTNGSQVVLRSADLVRALVDDGKAEFVRTMPDKMKVSAGAVTIDEHGDVVVNDPAFKDLIVKALATGPVGLSEEDGWSVNLQGGCIENIYCPKKLEEA
jgi:hypothetical protein